MANMYQLGGITGRRKVSYRDEEKIAGQTKSSIIDRLGDVMSDVQEDEASFQKIKGWTKPIIDAAIFSAMKLNPATGVFSTLLQVGGKAAMIRATDAIYDAIGRGIFGAGAKIEDIKLIGDKYGFSVSALKEMTENVEEVIKGKESEKWASALSSAALHQSGEGMFDNLFGTPTPEAIPDYSSVTYDVGTQGLSVPVNITDKGTFINPGANMDLVGPPEGIDKDMKILNTLQSQLSSGPTPLATSKQNILGGLVHHNQRGARGPASSITNVAGYPESGVYDSSQFSDEKTFMDLIRRMKEGRV